MKLYLVSDEQELLKWWQHALDSLHPISVSSLQDISPDGEAVAFVSDGLLLRNGSPSISDFPRSRIMVLSKVPDFEEAHRFLGEGAMGYGNAMMHMTHLHSAAQTLQEGKVWLYPDFIAQMILQVREINAHKEVSLHRLDVLTPREREVALLLNEGKSHIDIAEKLGITIRTVKAHSAAIYEKLGVKDRLALSLLLHS